MGARIASAEIARNYLWQLLMISPGLIAVRTIAPSTPVQVPITALSIPIPCLQASVAGGSASTAVLPVAIAAAGQVVVPAYGANPIIWPGLPRWLDVHPLGFPRWLLPWLILSLILLLLLLLLFLLMLVLFLLLLVLLLFLLILLLLLQLRRA